MLINLHVKNFAIIKELNIDFEDGLNILTGETGSGKSLILKAISFIKGERFNKDYLSNFGDKTLIEAVFTTNNKINSFLKDYGYDLNENIIISRSFSNNSSISKINNSACNVKLLSELGDMLFDIHGQHSQLIMLNKSNYIDLIDKFDTKTIELKADISKNLRYIDKLNKEIGELNLSDDEIEREKDLLKYQINEIEKFDFDNYNEEKLNSEYKKLTNQSELIKGIDNLLEIIKNSNKFDSLFELSSTAYNSMLDLQKLDTDLNEITSDVLNIRELIRDLGNKLENYSYTLEIDEERVQVIEDLFSNFQVLKLKYGRSKEEILLFLSEIKKRYNVINDIHNKKSELVKQISKLDSENKKYAEKLTNLRKAIIKNLEIDIIDQLSQMNMQHINFKISISTLEKIKNNGQDDIDFLISTNKGQELKSLNQVSSGGEISRFMLALKSVFVEKDDINTIIFDEIDAGISGKTADIVGNKLKDISNKVQLIVISHLAQISSKAEHHYLITKKIINEQTISSVEKLNKDERELEIARLISGSDITENSIKSARELLRGIHG